MTAAMTSKAGGKDPLQFDYDSWVKQVDQEADWIIADPHAYLKRGIKEEMRRSLPRFLKFLA